MINDGVSTVARKRFYLVLASCAILLTASGCPSSSSSTDPAPSSATKSAATSTASPSKPPAPPKSASELLNLMVRAYREATSYADAGKVQFRFERNGQVISDAADFSVTYQRPNQLRAHIYQAIVVSDGAKLRATIAELPGQVLELDATGKLDIDSLYRDDVLAAVLSRGIAGESPQLALLWMDDPIEPLLAGSNSTQLLDAEQVDGQWCYPVEVSRSDGTLKLWIDAKTYELRRLSYPVGELAKALSAEGPVQNLSLVAEFPGARLNSKIEPVAFQFETPQDAKIVQRFDATQRSAPPLLGKQPPAFTFHALDGTTMTPDSLAGKVVVLDFWFTTCAFCFDQLPELEKIYQQYKDDSRVVFAAVNVDDPAMANAEVQEAFRRAGITIPIVRDPADHATKSFEVPGFPTLFVIDGQGTVQVVEVGANPNIAAELPAKIEAVLAGKNLAAETLAEHEKRLQEIEENPQAIPAGSPEAPPAIVAEASLPSSLQLQPLWTNEELAAPGNILVVPDNDEPRVFVVDGWNAVVELDANGKIVMRHELDAPEDSPITFLRTATDASGKRYFVGATSAANQQQLHLFDENWQKLLAFPEVGGHAGIADVQFGDLNGDGEPELNVSYWGVVGVQNVSLKGQRNWSNRSMENVFRIAVGGVESDGTRKLWCSHGRGTLRPLSANGGDQPDVVIEGRYLHGVHIADLNGDDRPEIIGVAASVDGSDAIVGLAPSGAELWSYQLPRAMPQTAVEMVSHAAIDSGEQRWIIVAPDGSVHILAADGALIDHFNHGEPIAGLAVFEADGKPTLLIASKNRVQAWSIESP